MKSSDLVLGAVTKYNHRAHVSSFRIETASYLRIRRISPVVYVSIGARRPLYA